MLASVLLAACVLPLSAADLALKVSDKEPPKELGEGIRQTLQTKAAQVLQDNRPAFEFWFAREIPLKSRPASLAKALDSVAPATLLGAVSVAELGAMIPRSGGWYVFIHRAMGNYPS